VQRRFSSFQPPHANLAANWSRSARLLMGHAPPRSAGRLSLAQDEVLGTRALVGQLVPAGTLVSRESAASSGPLSRRFHFRYSPHL